MTPDDAGLDRDRAIGCLGRLDERGEIGWCCSASADEVDSRIVWSTSTLVPMCFASAIAVDSVAWTGWSPLRATTGCFLSDNGCHDVGTIATGHGTLAARCPATDPNVILSNRVAVS